MCVGIGVFVYLCVWTMKDKMAEDSNGGTTRDGALMGEAQASVKDRTLWRNIVVALCPTGDEEDK